MQISSAITDLIRERIGPRVLRAKLAAEDDARLMREVGDTSRNAAQAAERADLVSASRIGAVDADSTAGSTLVPRPVEPVEDPATLIERRSAELGLRTPSQRALESSLFIDEPLHRTALVSGHPTPELMFGESDWAGYLDARAFTRSYGDQELSVRFMTEINQRAGQFGPQDSGVFAEGTRWAVLGRPLTAEEAHTVEANPHLLHIEPGTPPLGNMSAVSYERKDAAAIRNELQSLSDWYNNARGAPGTDPYRLAAELQQRFVSIHPFTDYNGRSSRLLMNWALEREGLSPSVLPNFDRDILATSDEWAETVRAGSRTFAERADRLDRLGASADPVEIFGLQRLRALYNGHSGYIAPLRAGDDHDIYSVQKFLDVLEAGDKS